MSDAVFVRLVCGGAARADAPAGHRRKKFVNEKRAVEASIEDGRRVASYMLRIYGAARSDSFLYAIARRAKGSQPRAAAPTAPACVILVPSDSECEAEEVRRPERLPCGFWRVYLEQELGMQFTRRKRMQLTRALEFFAEKRQAGAQTLTAMRGMRARGSCRTSGGAMNRLLAPGLNFMLLQFFVDEVQLLHDDGKSARAAR